MEYVLSLPQIAHLNHLKWFSMKRNPTKRRLTHPPIKRNICFMARLCTFLVFLLLILTFNAYACVLPLQTSSHMDCPSNTEEPSRQACDAFLVIGPHSSSDNGSSPIHLDFAVVIQPAHAAVTAVQPTQQLLGRDTPTHPSIQTTVLRI